MTKKEALIKIKTVLDNLENVCSNKLKAEAILDELEKETNEPKMKQTTEPNKKWEH